MLWPEWVWVGGKFWDSQGPAEDLAELGKFRPKDHQDSLPEERAVRAEVTNSGHSLGPAEDLDELRPDGQSDNVEKSLLSNPDSLGTR